MDTSSKPMVYVAVATFAVALASIVYFGRLSSRDQVSMTSEIRSLESDVAAVRTQIKDLSKENEALKRSLAATSGQLDRVANRLPAGDGALLTRRDLDAAVAKETKQMRDDIARLRTTLSQIRRDVSTQKSGAPPKANEG
jgi:chromosome segregation ATPase